MKRPSTTKVFEFDTGISIRISAKVARRISEVVKDGGDLFLVAMEKNRPRASRNDNADTEAVPATEQAKGEKA